MKKKNIIALIVAVLLITAYAALRERHLVYFFFHAGADASAATPCDESLWRFNAEKEKVIIPCITLTGVVERKHKEADGDENIQVRPDADYMHLLNAWNILLQWGDIAVEPICENAPTKKEFIEACAGYKSALTLPHVGDRVSVTGSYGTDKHGWAEIHPVTRIDILP